LRNISLKTRAVGEEESVIEVDEEKIFGFLRESGARTTLLPIDTGRDGAGSTSPGPKQVGAHWAT